MSFQFLEYLAAHPDMGLQELENLSDCAYKTLESGATGLASTATPANLSVVGFEEKEGMRTWLVRGCPARRLLSWM